MQLKKRIYDLQAFFDERTDGYDDVHNRFMGSKISLTEALTAAFPDRKNLRVLDLGAGTGLELIPLFKAFPEAQVTAVDVSEKMLAVLMKRPFSVNITCMVGDFFETDFGADYDAVISTSALHHFSPEDKVNLYRKLYAAMKPGGIFVNADKCADDTAEQELCFRELEEDPKKYNHMDTPLTVECECDVLRRAGFVTYPVRPLPNAKYHLFTARKPE